MILDQLGAVLVELAREPARLLDDCCRTRSRAGRSTGSRWRCRSCPCPRARAAGDHFGGGGAGAAPRRHHGVDVELRDEVVMDVDAGLGGRRLRGGRQRDGRSSRRRPGRARRRRRRGNSAAPGLPATLAGSQQRRRGRIWPSGWHAHGVPPDGRFCGRPALASDLAAVKRARPGCVGRHAHVERSRRLSASRQCALRDRTAVADATSRVRECVRNVACRILLTPGT